MGKKKFDQEVDRFRKMSDRVAREEKQRKFFLENEPDMASRLTEAMKIAGKSYVGDYTIGTMIGQIKLYRSSEYRYSFIEAVYATMWGSLQFEPGIDKSNVDRAIKKFIDYRPKTASKDVVESVQCSAFKNDHPILFFVVYVLMCLAVLDIIIVLIVMVTDNVFLRFFIPTIVTGFYVLFTWDCLKKKSC